MSAARTPEDVWDQAVAAWDAWWTGDATAPRPENPYRRDDRCLGMAPFACGNPHCPAHNDLTGHLITDPLCTHYCGVEAVPGGYCPICNSEPRNRDGSSLNGPISDKEG